MKHDIFDRPECIIEANRQQKGSRNLALELLIFLLVFLIGSVAQALLIVGPTLGWMFTGERMQTIMSISIEAVRNGSLLPDMSSLMEMIENMPVWLTAVSLLSTAGMAVIAALYCKKFEKRKLRTLGFVKKGAFGEYALGALIGAAMFAAAFGIAMAFGGVEISGVAFTVDALPALGLLLAGFLVQGASEEIVFRGYLMTTLSKRYSLPVCIGVSSIVFGLMHSGNSGFNLMAFLNISLFGVFIGIYMLKRGSLWGACALHSLWNFVQGNVFGLPVSGMNVGSSVLTSQITSPSEALTGGDFGLEASLPVTIVLLLAIAVVCALKGRNVPAKPESPESPESPAPFSEG